MISVTASISGEHYTTTIHSDTNTMLADESVDNGGTGAAFSPSEILASSLGSCTCITLRMYADHKQWPLERVVVKVTYGRDAARNVSDMNREISLTGNLDDAQRERLMQIADQCPMHRTLSNPITINTTLL